MRYRKKYNYCSNWQTFLNYEFHKNLLKRRSIWRRTPQRLFSARPPEHSSPKIAKDYSAWIQCFKKTRRFYHRKGWYNQQGTIAFIREQHFNKYKAGIKGIIGQGILEFENTQNGILEFYQERLCG